MPTISIRSNPSNPLNFLASCGVFEIASRFDSRAVAHWQCATPVALAIESSFDDPCLADAIIDACRNVERWQFKVVPEWNDVWRVDFTVTLGGKSYTIPLDWWQETVNIDGSIDKKSAWKMYAGQQTIQKITADMVAQCSALSKSLPQPHCVSDLIAANAGMTGRFGFDPRSSRSALDVGFSPNDLMLPVATYPFAELLATIGIQAFFAPRCGIPGRLASSRAWHLRDEASGFRYRLWQQALPVALARLAASLDDFGPAIALESPRATRKNYSNLTLAKTR